MTIEAWVGRHRTDRQAARRLARLPEVEHGAKVPMLYSDRSAYKDAASNRLINRLINAPAPLRVVTIKDVRAIQHSVSRSRVASYIRDPLQLPPGTRSRKRHKGLVDFPIVVSFKGVLYLHDGHHRFTAEILKGHTQAVVRFVDLDKALASAA